MKGVVLCNGDRPSAGLLRQELADADFVVCADGAAKYALEAGVKVDLFVGDLDSLEEKDAVEKLGCETVFLPEDKDMTDGEIAARLAAERGCSRITLLGATGGRMDHFLGSVQVLVALCLLGVSGCIADEQNRIYVTCTHMEFDGQLGDFLSLIPLGVNVRIRSTSGLLYPLILQELPLGTALGISNRFSCEHAAVDVADGWVIVVLSRDAAVREAR